MGFLQRSANVGNSLIVLGFLGLGFTFLWPHVTASRLVRIDNWGERLAELLLEAAVGPPTLDLEDPDAARKLLSTLGNDAARLRPIDRPPADHSVGLYFEGKHYMFVVTRPPAQKGTQWTPPLEAPLEVYAWPRSTLDPAHTAFFFSEDAKPAYTHNLRARYAGMVRVPRPANGRPTYRDQIHPNTYRGFDDERWIELPQSSQR